MQMHMQLQGIVQIHFIKDNYQITAPGDTRALQGAGQTSDASDPKPTLSSALNPDMFSTC